MEKDLISFTEREKLPEKSCSNFVGIKWKPKQRGKAVCRPGAPVYCSRPGSSWCRSPVTSWAGGPAEWFTTDQSILICSKIWFTKVNNFQMNLFLYVQTDEKIRVLIRTGATIDLAPIEILSMDAWYPSWYLQGQENSRKKFKKT